MGSLRGSETSKRFHTVLEVFGTIPPDTQSIWSLKKQFMNAENSPAGQDALANERLIYTGWDKTAKKINSSVRWMQVMLRPWSSHIQEQIRRRKSSFADRASTIPRLHRTALRNVFKPRGSSRRSFSPPIRTSSQPLIHQALGNPSKMTQQAADSQAL